LAGQSRLRLVVLNSCDGARTSLVDPYAGVATTLIQLGVPAVVAMQFEITDRAAICFAEELYTNLIGRQAPIDAAVAEARLAVYIEVDKVEWATPVLFVRHPDDELFRFMVDPAPLPPPPSIDHERPQPPPQPPPPPPPWWEGRGGPLGAAGAVPLAVAAALLVASRDDGGGVVPEPPRPPPHNEASRAHTGDYALEILGAARDSKLYIAAPGVGLWFGQVASFGAKGEALTPVASPEGPSDTQPAWDRNTNRLAFVRSSEGTASIWYAVPGETSDDPGTQPARLITPVSGESHRFPTWGR